MSTTDRRGWSDNPELIEQFFQHPSFVHVSSHSSWTEAIHLYYCRVCHSVFKSNTIHSLGEDLEEEHTVQCLTGDVHNRSFKKHFEAVGAYLWALKKQAEIEDLSEGEGDIDVYLSGHVHQLQALRQNRPLKVSALREQVHFSFSEILCAFSRVRWFINSHYYIKASVPKSSLSSVVNSSESNLGSGRHGFSIQSTDLVGLEQIQVFDPILSKFVPLKEWTIPPVYEQSDEMVDRYFELYKREAELHASHYQQVVNEKKVQVDAFLSELYGLR